MEDFLRGEKINPSDWIYYKKLNNKVARFQTRVDNVWLTDVQCQGRFVTINSNAAMLVQTEEIPT